MICTVPSVGRNPKRGDDTPFEAGYEMKRKRFAEEQSIGISNGALQARNIRERCRLNDISEQTLYRWRAKFGGMDI